MAKESAILRFENVSFEYGQNKPILDEVNFNVRENSKITIMGQNGAGKSTIFSLITRNTKPESGQVFLFHGLSVGISRQVIPRSDLALSVREFFTPYAKATAGQAEIYNIDKQIDDVLEVVNLPPSPKASAGQAKFSVHDRLINSFSGGQQARLLLASALIQDPDLLLLDEPTNNLDKAGIEHLVEFLKGYKKTLMVISHDADFLNSFTDGVLYLDIHTRKVEQYVGNYFDVVDQIALRVEKERRKNAQLEKEIQANKDKSNFFANKGGQMRLVARRMRDKAEELEESMVDTRREDKTIRPFIIPFQKDHVGNILTITSFSTLNFKTHPSKKVGTSKSIVRKVNIVVRKNQHLLLRGPNGIGKSTLLEST